MAKRRPKTKPRKETKSRKVNYQDLSMPPDHDLATCEDWAFDILEQEMNARLAKANQKSKVLKPVKKR